MIMTPHILSFTARDQNAAGHPPVDGHKQKGASSGKSAANQHNANRLTDDISSVTDTCTDSSEYGITIHSIFLTGSHIVPLEPT